ncbi:unnamed protein product [Tuber melanosporum]|uniref:(Perigord truffle) hypothetical protein n=1 Tax=Tuber melanosporum (strain Mel28) TaxID=656061 RepID=D5GM54_TUBMM|nr:uncharacterized protein GSTUM_00010532001 [Tuber melanosporum]CAZ85597.1 unnamed protein product [Tuber melanosporum]
MRHWNCVNGYIYHHHHCPFYSVKQKQPRCTRAQHSASSGGGKQSRLGNSQFCPPTHFYSRPNRKLMWRFIDPRRTEH